MAKRSRAACRHKRRVLHSSYRIAFSFDQIWFVAVKGKEMTQVVTRTRNLTSCLFGGWALIRMSLVSQQQMVVTWRGLQKLTGYTFAGVVSSTRTRRRARAHACRKGLFTQTDTQNWFLRERWTLNPQQTDSGEESCSVSVLWVSRVAPVCGLTKLPVRSWIMRLLVWPICCCCPQERRTKVTRPLP